MPLFNGKFWNLIARIINNQQYYDQTQMVIPAEIFTHIIKFIDHAETFCRVCQLCKRINNIAKQWISIKMKQFAKYGRLPNSKYYRCEIKQTDDRYEETNIINGVGYFYHASNKVIEYNYYYNNTSQYVICMYTDHDCCHIFGETEDVIYDFYYDNKGNYTRHKSVFVISLDNDVKEYSEFI